jgi:hypothetical protein
LKRAKPKQSLSTLWQGDRFLSTGVPVFDRDGKIRRIYCNLRDITELNILKEKFEESQMLISKYLVGTP